MTIQSLAGVTIFLVCSLTSTRAETLAHSKVLDIGPKPNCSTVVGVLHTLAQTVGKTESEAKLQGVLGHAFSFEMERGGGDVWQEENLDYLGLFLQMIPKLGYKFKQFEATQRGAPDGFQELKTDAWRAVRESIDKGIPVIAWQPMSREQKAAGLRAGAWGLLVGYNEIEGTYTVRHQYHKKGQESYKVRYDAIGHSDPREWFHVLVFNGYNPVDPMDTHITALQNAVAFANGTRWDSTKTKHQADALGFAAFELWRMAIVSGEARPKHSLNHARELVNWRKHAALYLREIAKLLPQGQTSLNKAATHYERLVETASKLQNLCDEVSRSTGFSQDTRNKASSYVTALLQAEENAITAIKAAINSQSSTR